MKRLAKFPTLDKQIDIRPRHPKLMELEGWYDTNIILRDDYATWYQRYLDSGSRQKPTRWLSQHMPESFVSEFGKKLVITRFKLSCRHNDMIRLDETPHYKTCMNKAYSFGRQQLRYLGDPDIALIYVPDAAGKFVWRALVRLVMLERGYALVHYRIYGNGPTEAIFAKLNESLPLYEAQDIRREKVNSQWLTSPTVHNNPSMLRAIWTDHRVRVNQDNRLEVLVNLVNKGELCLKIT